MINLLEFDNFLNEADIPIFDDDDYSESLNPKPKKTVKSTKLIEEVEILLSKVQAEEYDAVHVIAEIPTRGKRAPEYVKELIEEDRIRRERRETLLYGSRRTAEDRAIGPDGKPDIPDINIFIDSEFKVDRIEKDEEGESYIIGFPLSYLKKIDRNPKLKEKYFAKIYPQDVIDVTYFVAY
jgi:hypothetical protein